MLTVFWQFNLIFWQYFPNWRFWWILTGPKGSFELQSASLAQPQLVLSYFFLFYLYPFSPLSVSYFYPMSTLNLIHIYPIVSMSEPKASWWRRSLLVHQCLFPFNLYDNFILSLSFYYNVSTIFQLHVYPHWSN